MSKNKQELLPFDESVVDFLNCIRGNVARYVAELLKTTKIPKNHDRIIKCWKLYLEHLEREGHKEEDYGVTESLLLQKKVAAEKAKKSKTKS